MMDNKTKKVIMTSLSALLFGCIFFIFGISITTSNLPLLVNYIISLLLFIASYLAVHNNNKDKINVLTYLEYLNIFFIIFITIVFFIQLL